MKCWSRSTLGVVVGILNILGYIVISIVMIGMMQDVKAHYDLVKPNKTSQEREQVAALGTTILSVILVTCLAMAIISGVLIMGIVKRRHTLMLPWLILSGLGFACDCGRTVLALIMGLAQGQDVSMILFTFFLSVLIIGVEALILWPIYTLWKDIRTENKQKPGQIISYEGGPVSAPPQYNYYTSIPNKS